MDSSRQDEEASLDSNAALSMSVLIKTESKGEKLSESIESDKVEKSFSATKPDDKLDNNLSPSKGVNIERNLLKERFFFLFNT